MTVSELASIGEFVSGIAVLISLIYLTVQVRQAKENQRAVLSQGSVMRFVLNTHWIADPARTALLTRVTAGETDFLPEEWVQLNMILRASVLGGQDAHGQYEAGLIDRMSYDNTRLILKSMFAQPVMRALWIDLRSTIAPDFRAEVDKIIAETPIVAGRDITARAQANLAQVMAEAGAGGDTPDLAPAVG